MNFKILLITLIICSNQLMYTSELFEVHAKKLLNSSLDDIALEQEVNVYSQDGLQKLKEAFQKIKCDPEWTINHKAATRGGHAIMSLIPVSMILASVNCFREAFCDLRHSATQRSFAEIMLGLDMHKEMAEGFALLGGLLSIGGIYFLYHTLPGVFSSFNHEETIVKKINTILDMIDKRINRA